MSLNIELPWLDPLLFHLDYGPLSSPAAFFFQKTRGYLYDKHQEMRGKYWTGS